MNDDSEPRVLWLPVLAVGAGLWIFNIVVSYLSDDEVLLSPMLLLGSFLIPVACTLAAFARIQRGSLTPKVTGAMAAVGFAAGGLGSLALSVVLDVGFADRPPSELLPIVAVAEAVAKLCGVWWVARRLTIYRRREGMMLGAAVGFGFSAFETLGISFSMILEGGRSDVPSVVQNMVIRDLLSPFQHGLWTALVGGALFTAASTRNKLHLDRTVIGWVAVAALMHLLWDFAPNMGSLVSALVDGTAVDWPAFNDPWVPQVPTREAVVRTTVTAAVLVADAVLGAALVHRMWTRTEPSTGQMSPRSSTNPVDAGRP